jgi:hypothetical protein
VRQLNLYGFKKIKTQGKQRFTHSLLQSGCSYISSNARLSAITSFKCSKQKEQQDINRTEQLTVKSQPETNPLPLPALQKQTSSAFTRYNPNAENRSVSSSNQNE